MIVKSQPNKIELVTRPGRVGVVVPSPCKVLMACKGQGAGHRAVGQLLRAYCPLALGRGHRSLRACQLMAKLTPMHPPGQ